MAGSSAAQNVTNTRSAVEADHHVGRLDDGVGVLPDFKPQLIDRLVGDRGRNDEAVHIEPNMRGGHAFLDFDNLPLSRFLALIFTMTPLGLRALPGSNRPIGAGNGLDINGMAECVRPDRSSPCQERSPRSPPGSCHPRRISVSFLIISLFTSSKAAK